MVLFTHVLSGRKTFAAQIGGLQVVSYPQDSKELIQSVGLLLAVCFALVCKKEKNKKKTKRMGNEVVSCLQGLGFVLSPCGLHKTATNEKENSPE
jgi:hypothetical protein